MIRGLLHGGAEIEGFWANGLYTLVRIATGLMMAFGHGLGKLPPSDKFIEGVAEMGFPSPSAFAWAAALSEFAGSLLIVLGLATRPAALMLVATMSTAAFMRHGMDPFDVKERALLYLCLCLIFVALGAGRYGLDRRLRN